MNPAQGRLRRIAGTGELGYEGDSGPALTARFGAPGSPLTGPKGVALGGSVLYISDTENHVIRSIDLRSGIIRTVLGTGQRGDGPEPDPRRCALSRPHGVMVDARGVLYVSASEAVRPIITKTMATTIAMSRSAERRLRWGSSDGSSSAG